MISRLIIVPVLLVSLFNLITHVGIYHQYDVHVETHSHSDASETSHQHSSNHASQDPDHPLHADANHCIAGLLHIPEIVNFSFSPLGVFVPEGLVYSLTLNPILTDLVTTVGRAPPPPLV